MDRIWIWFADNGNIRKWQREPFEEGTEFRAYEAHTRPEPVIEALTVDEVEQIICRAEPPSLSDKGDKVWTRRMAVVLANTFNARLAAIASPAKASTDGDREETVERNPKSWAAWKREYLNASADANKFMRQLQASEARARRMEEALVRIEQLEPQPFDLPPDWQEQIADCPECQSYKTHPIQQGICNTHRKPLYRRDEHDDFERKAIGSRAKEIARAALSDSPASAARMEPGCCSAISPCSHQRKDPTTICDVCREASADRPAVTEAMRFHIDRAEAWLRELWRVDDIALHFCDGPVRDGQTGLLRDIREDTRAILAALEAALSAAPAQPEGESR